MPSATLHTSKPNALARLFNPWPDFSMVSRHHVQRGALEGYIGDKFRKDHGATIRSFMPYLLTISCGGNFSAAVGIRPAATEKLFVETYLDAPIEQYVSRVSEKNEGRNGIVEIGNLVATQGGTSQLVFILLTAVLAEAGHQWVAFTATAQVKHLLEKLNFTCHRLAAADPSRLGASAAEWGSYYANSPQVMVIHVGEALEKIGNNRLASAALALCRPAIPALADRLMPEKECLVA